MKIKNNNLGFSLAECLISILLLAIALIGGMAFYTNSSEVMGLTLHKKMAMEMAMQEMEQIKKDGQAGLPEPASGVWVSGSVSTVTFGDPAQPFSGQLQKKISDVEGTAPNKNKKVEVQVSWTEAGETNPRTVNLQTLMAL
jgi:Tfp pilus assembly protein PilV